MSPRSNAFDLQGYFSDTMIHRVTLRNSPHSQERRGIEELSQAPEPI